MPAAIRLPGTGPAAGRWPAGEPFCIIMVESAQALADLEATLAVDGVDGIYVGPRDLSLLARLRARPGRPGAAAGPASGSAPPAPPRASPVGMHASDGATARRFLSDGCSLITVVSDALAVSRGAAGELGAAQG